MISFHKKYKIQKLSRLYRFILLLNLMSAFTYPETLFHQQIFQNFDKFHDKLALKDKYDELTFGNTKIHVFYLTNILRKLGLQKGDFILVCLPNSCLYPVLLLAAAECGIIMSGINSTATQKELEYFTDQVSPKLIVLKHDTDVSYKTICDNNGIKVLFAQDTVAGTLEEWSYGVDVQMEESVKNSETSIMLDDVFIASFSSGTTGLPKCCLLTHRNFSAATQSLKSGLFEELLEKSVSHYNVAFLPFCHASGLWALLYSLMEGCSTVILEAFNPIEVVEIVEEYKVDILNVVPAILSVLTRLPSCERSRMSSIRFILCGASRLSPSTSSEFLAAFPDVSHIIQGYGMTEVVALSHMSTFAESSVPLRNANCGRLLPGFEAKIVNEESQNEIDGEESGELWLRSDAIMTAPCNNGWYHTGDILRRDSNGHFYVVGRIKDFIKVNGLQVSPAELEDLLFAHELVNECVVIGLDDEQAGQKPAAFIVRRPNEIITDQLLIDQLNANIQKNCAIHKQLTGGIFFMEFLPRNNAGKINKMELLKLAHLK